MVTGVGHRGPGTERHYKHSAESNIWTLANLREKRCPRLSDSSEVRKIRPDQCTEPLFDTARLMVCRARIGSFFFNVYLRIASQIRQPSVGVSPCNAQPIFIHNGSDAPSSLFKPNHQFACLHVLLSLSFPFHIPPSCTRIPLR